MSPFINSWLSGIIVSVAVLLVSACGGDNGGTVSPTVPPASRVEAPPPVVEWYPAPKHQHRPQYFMPSPAPAQRRQTGVSSPNTRQQPVWGGGYGQSVPPAWVAPVPPAAGYGSASGVPAQGGMYAPIPAWGQYMQPTQPAQQPYYPQASQYTYTQRPWGETDAASNSKRAGQSIDSWQMNSGSPAWGVPADGGYPSHESRQQAVQPQYYW